MSEHIVGELRLRNFATLDRLAPPAPAPLDVPGRRPAEPTRPAAAAPAQRRVRARSIGDRHL